MDRARGGAFHQALHQRGCVLTGLEEVLAADAAEGGDEDAVRLLELLSALGEGVPAPCKRGDSESLRCRMRPTRAWLRPLH